MNDVALEIIKQIGDELQKVRDEMKSVQAILRKTESELKEQRESATYWWTQWNMLHEKYEKQTKKEASK